MRWTVLLLATACAAASGGSVLQAQEPEAAPDLREIRTVEDLVELREFQRGEILAGRVTVELVDAPVVDVFRSLERMMRQHAAKRYPNLDTDRLRIDVSPALDGTVTLCLHNVSLRTTVAALCESAGCGTAWHVGEDLTMTILPVSLDQKTGRLERKTLSPAERLEETVDVNVVNAAAGDLLPSFCGFQRLAASLAPQLESRPVTMEFRGPLKDAFDEMCQQISCTWRLDGEVVRFELR